MPVYPLKKNKILLNSSENLFLSNYSNVSEIPILNHPGSFGKVRKFHIHEGVDLYCEKGDKVYNIEDGKIIKIKLFTGPEVNSPWWNKTYCMLIECEFGVFNFGEILPNPELREGMYIKKNMCIGVVETVLKKNKGRPMTMLHLELYKNNTKDSISCWPLNTNKPNHLLDPTNILLNIKNN